jgi:hypothetical protein
VYIVLGEKQCVLLLFPLQHALEKPRPGLNGIRVLGYTVSNVLKTAKAIVTTNESVCVSQNVDSILFQVSSKLIFTGLQSIWNKDVVEQLMRLN